MEICAICQSEVVDKVSMTCSSMHKFCFKCILKYIEKNNKLTNCPYCRGSSKYILIEKNDTNSDSFYDTNYLKKSLNVLSKVFKDIETNSCIVSDMSLVHYIRNQKQLNLFFKALQFYEKEEHLIQLIKWDTFKVNIGFSDSADLIGNFITNVVNDPETVHNIRTFGTFFTNE